MGKQRDRHGSHKTDRREVLARVNAKLRVEAGVDRQRPGMAEQQGVAVRRSARDGACANRSAAAAAVVDGHRLTECVGQLLCHHAGHGIDAAAGRVRHNERDIAGRELSRMCDRHYARHADVGDCRCNDDRCGHDSVATR
jgi:hypothetical protein